MKLCRSAGRLDYDQALDEMSEQQFQKWMALDLIEPLDRTERILAVLSAIVANQWRGEDTEPLGPQDIVDMADGKTPKSADDELSPDQAAARLRASLGRNNG